MRTFTSVYFLSLIFLSLASCSALPSKTFSTEKIMQIHQGMGSNEILALFGEPQKISVAVCGRPPDQWTCTTWEYGERYNKHASFTFGGQHDSLRLNDFEVDRR